MLDPANPILPERLTKSTLSVMTFAVGISVANIYYNQPLLDQMRESFHLDFSQVGLIPTLTQAGYASGMFFLIPLGDKLERKKWVLFFTLLSALAAAVLSMAPNFLVLMIASFLLGVATMTPQFLLPFAASLAKPEERGKVIGTMVTGLLLGILLARTVSGFIGAAYGWRFLFGLAAAMQVLLCVILSITLPRSKPSYHGTYFSLLKSVVQIFKEQPVLQEACLFGAMLFGAFSVFWATLIHLMQSQTFNLGARAVGLYGLLGAIAAGLTPMVGAIIDKKSPRKATGFMVGLAVVSFLVFFVSGASLIGIAVGVVLMDIGVQGGHVSNQSRILALLPDAQSRLQTAYMFFYFAGGAAGSFFGSLAWSKGQWPGVCIAAISLLAVAFIRFLKPSPGVGKHELRMSEKTRA